MAIIEFFYMLSRLCDVALKFANDGAPLADQWLQEYLDEHDRIQRITEDMNRQFEEQARELATAAQQPIGIQIQIEKER